MKTVAALLFTALFTPFLLHGQTNKQATANRAESPTAEQVLQKMEQTWAEAVKNRDTAKIDQIQADDYVFTGPGGEVWTKAHALEMVKAGDLEIDSFQLSDFKVRLYGNTAVVSFEVTWNGRFRGTDISGPQRMMDVFVKQDGRWQCVASQTTRIGQP